MFPLVLILVSFIGKMEAQSIFETGDWFKVATTNSGIYKLDKTYLENIGVDISDPTKIAVFGGDAKALPQQINLTPYDNPEEIPSFLVNDETSDDFTIFFKGEDLESKGVNSNSLIVEKNIYSDSVFYFITVLEQSADRIDLLNLTKGTERETVKRIDYHEKEEINLHGSGRIWLSNRMTVLAPITEISLKAESILFDGRLNFDIVGTSFRARIFFDIEVNGEVLETINTARTNSGYGIKARSNSGFVFVPKELIGEEILLILDEDIQNPIILNDSILIEKTSKNVNASITLNDLTIGEHSIEIVVWDIHGNVSSKEIIINVGDEREISVSPNPLENELKIEFKQTILNQPYIMELSLSDPNGTILIEQEEKMSGNNFVETFELEISKILRPGVYYYRLKVRYEGSNVYFEDTGKLVKF